MIVNSMAWPDGAPQLINRSRLRHKLSQLREQYSPMEPAHDSSESNHRLFDYAQQELFALDPWGATQSFAVVDRPDPAIARAMVGPLLLGGTGASRSYTLKCLAVTADGEFATCVQVVESQLRDERAMWALVASKLVEARQCLLDGQSQGLPSPQDCLRAWLHPAFWLPAQTSGDPIHRSVRSLARLLRIREVAATNVMTDEIRLTAERDAHEIVTEQISQAVYCVLCCLRTELFDVLCMRQGLSLSVMQRLLAQAQEHGSCAESYTLQALRTESLSLLHLAASANPLQESQQIRETIFNGESLPNTLAAMGVSKAAHRRSLKPESRSAVHVPDAMHDWSELPLAGAHWLATQRIVRERMPASDEEWTALRRLISSLASLDIQDPATSATLCRWCTRSGYTRSGHKLDRLVSQARAIQNAAATLVHSDLTLDRALAFAMSGGAAHTITESEEIALLPRSAGQLAILAAIISGQSIEQITKEIFDAHPGLPAGLQLPPETNIFSLNSISSIVRQGKACRNCLQDAARAIQYVADGLALYSVSVKGRIEGTIALRGYRSHWCQRVLVREVTGVDNADPSPELTGLAEVLANGWSDDEQIAAWFSYERACEGWKQSMD